MIYVHRNTDGSYTVKLDAPEQIMLSKIGQAYSLPLREAMGAVVLRGMENIGKLIVAVESSKSDDKDKQDHG